MRKKNIEIEILYFNIIYKNTNWNMEFFCGKTNACLQKKILICYFKPVFMLLKNCVSAKQDVKICSFLNCKQKVYNYRFILILLDVFFVIGFALQYDFNLCFFLSSSLVLLKCFFF